ncbi:MAG: hypothetical protein NZ870_04645, partial [bacterium]|nr:hypothetical protein [bacterium]
MIYLVLFLYTTAETSDFFIKMPISAFTLASGIKSIGFTEPFSLEHNPAKLGHIIKKQLSAGIIKGFMDFESQGIGFVYPRRYVYGFLFKNSGVRNIDSYDETGLKTGSFDVNEKIFIFSISKKLTGISNNFLNIGTSLKYIVEDFRYASANAFLFNLGFFYKYTLTHGLEAGLSFIDYGTGFKFFEETSQPPSKFVFGIGYVFRLFTIDTLSTYIEFISERSSSYINYAFEYNLWRHWRIRTGFTSKNIIGPKVSYGIGFRIKKLNIDLATSNFAFLENSSSMS